MSAVIEVSYAFFCALCTRLTSESSARATVSGCSTALKWPQSGISMNSAPVIRSASGRITLGLLEGSSSPDTTRLGALIVSGTAPVQAVRRSCADAKPDQPGSVR